MAISKVILNNDVQIDITDTTASQSDVASTKYYYGADGVKKQGSYVAPSAVTQATPTISVNSSTGLITASSTQSAGVVSAGTKSATEQLSTENGKTVTPTTSEQTAVAANKYTLGAIKVAAMPAGSAATPATSITANPSISVSSGGLITATTSATKSVTPTVSAGYVSSGTAGTITVSGSNTEQLTTQAAQTLYPSTSDQTISSGKYLTGTQTVKGVLLTNLTADNIADGVTVKVGDSADDDRIARVTGTHKGGVVSEPEKDVNYIDYDGTILYSYTKTEFASLSAHPANPVHDGLTAQGWNWTLSDAKTYVATYGKLWIGQMYITSDGKTRIYIHLEKGRLSPYLGIAVDGTATIEWGDGSSNSTVTSTSTWSVISTQHNYAAAGDYVIAISVSGSMAFIGDDEEDSGSWVLWNNNDLYGARNKVYQNTIQRIEIGANTSLGGYAFEECGSLSNITMPSSIDSIDWHAFQGCSNLASITIPNSAVSISDAAFYGCAGLINIAIPNSVIDILPSAFDNCINLTGITIPGDIGNNNGSLFSGCSRLSSIVVFNNIGTYMFSGCSGLANITILSGVTGISAYSFNNCYGLGEIHFRPTSPPTVANQYTFNSLSSDCIIYVPTGCLSAYQSATNYPNPNTYTYMEE